MPCKACRTPREAGGVSGAPVHELSLRVIERLRSRLGDAVAIIGVGGILSGRQANEKWPPAPGGAAVYRADLPRAGAGRRMRAGTGSRQPLRRDPERAWALKGLALGKKKATEGGPNSLCSVTQQYYSMGCRNSPWYDQAARRLRPAALVATSAASLAALKEALAAAFRLLSATSAACWQQPWSTNRRRCWPSPATTIRATALSEPVGAFLENCSTASVSCCWPSAIWASASWASSAYAGTTMSYTCLP